MENGKHLPEEDLPVSKAVEFSQPSPEDGSFD
jgi:hypothetical protein